jgi:hypothetical protein
MSAETVANMFIDYGDFYVYKDTDYSCFFEFFYIDGNQVPDKTPESFIKVVMVNKKLRVVYGCTHQNAPRFTAHNRIDDL